MTKQTSPKANTRIIKSDSDLAKDSYDLRFEYTGLLYCSEPLALHAVIGMEYITLLNSFLVHARNLNGFFFAVDIDQRRKPKSSFHIEPTDMIAEDYFEGVPSWVKPIANALTEGELEEINKRLAHLTYGRPKDELYKWDVAGIRDRLDKTYTDFVEHVPSTRIEPVMSQGLVALRARYGLTKAPPALPQ